MEPSLGSIGVNLSQRVARIQYSNISQRLSQALRRVAAMDITANPACTIYTLLCADVLALTAAVLLSGAAEILGTGLGFGLFWRVIPILALFVIAFAGSQLYPVVALRPVEELRRASLATTVIFMALAAACLASQRAAEMSWLRFSLAWALAVSLVPLGRALVRHLCSRKDWWGYPCVVLGAGTTGQMIVRILQREPELGLKPVAILDDDKAKHGFIEGVPVLGKLSLAPTMAQQHGINHAVVAMPSLSHKELMDVMERHGGHFSNVLLIPDLFGFSSLECSAKDVGGVPTLEVRQQLLVPSHLFIKRTIDIVATVIGGLAIMPLLLLIALAIKLDSPGPVFYRQKRLGRDNKRFMTVKFRTMHGDGEQRLKELLDNDPALRAEYEVYHKLKNDPRITRVGRFLRKFSLDEFPQLWNVLKGDMSLVGPRPYLEREVPEMNEREAIILKAKPGMTGMWQVTARNKASFPERLNMDVYYVRSWSLWLDIYILARTFTVVASGSGS